MKLKTNRFEFDIQTIVMIQPRQVITFCDSEYESGLERAKRYLLQRGIAYKDVFEVGNFFTRNFTKWPCYCIRDAVVVTQSDNVTVDLKNMTMTVEIISPEVRSRRVFVHKLLEA